jgi:hypothetical protein
MNKNLKLLGMFVLLLTLCLSLSSCFTLIATAGYLIAGAGQDIKQNTAIKNELAQLGDRDARWRRELAYNTTKKGETYGNWYGMNIQGWDNDSFLQIANLVNGVSVLNILRSSSYAFPNYALVSSDDKPAGETSFLTLKELGSTDNITYTVSYILSIDGSNFTITDLGGINHPILKTGTYLNSDAKKDANARVLAGYGTFTVRNISSNHSITMISINGGRDRIFSQTYQVNLSPAASGMAGMLGGGSFEVGDMIAGKKVIPIGDYELTLSWSNGAQTKERITITSSGSIGNYNQ